MDGKTLRGSRDGDTVARHLLAAADHAAGAVLASTDVDGKTNEITRFRPLLDQISDLDTVVVTADALHVSASTSPTSPIAAPTGSSR